MYLIDEIKAGFKEIEGRKGDEKKTVLAAGVVFALISVYFYLKSGIIGFSFTGIASAVFILVRLIGGKSLRGVYLFWMKISVVMGAVMSRILLALVFFLVLTPIAFFSRVSGKDPLNLKRKTASGYWVTKNEFPDNYKKKY